MGRRPAGTHAMSEPHPQVGSRDESVLPGASARPRQALTVDLIKQVAADGAP
jgi:hypothetical protein